MNKKVLIISQDGFEETTDLVIDWLVYLGGDFERVNGSVLAEYLKRKEHIISGFDNKNSFVDSDINEFSAIWFRRWGMGNSCLKAISQNLDKDV